MFQWRYKYHCWLLLQEWHLKQDFHSLYVFGNFAFSAFLPVNLTFKCLPSLLEVVSKVTSHLHSIINENYFQQIFVSSSAFYLWNHITVLDWQTKIKFFWKDSKSENFWICKMDFEGENRIKLWFQGTVTKSVLNFIVILLFFMSLVSLFSILWQQNKCFYIYLYFWVAFASFLLNYLLLCL